MIALFPFAALGSRGYIRAHFTSRRSWTGQIPCDNLLVMKPGLYPEASLEQSRAAMKQGHLLA
jgi:hypothetical protein